MANWWPGVAEKNCQILLRSLALGYHIPKPFTK